MCLVYTEEDRMLLHAIHADKVFAESCVKGRIIIKSLDTDVLILCVHYFSKLQHTQELWFQTGTRSTRESAMCLVYDQSPPTQP
jgi:hypothetical protein